MDKYGKISAVYILLPVVLYGGLGILSLFSPETVRGLVGFLNTFNLIFLVYHLVYLKYTLEDTRERDESKLWVVVVALTGILGALIYLFKRR